MPPSQQKKIVTHSVVASQYMPVYSEKGQEVMISIAEFISSLGIDTNVENYLPLSGGTMTGAISRDGTIIQSIADPDTYYTIGPLNHFWTVDDGLTYISLNDTQSEIVNPYVILRNSDDTAHVLVSTLGTPLVGITADNSFANLTTDETSLGSGAYYVYFNADTGIVNLSSNDAALLSMYSDGNFEITTDFGGFGAAYLLGTSTKMEMAFIDDFVRVYATEILISHALQTKFTSPIIQLQNIQVGNSGLASKQMYKDTAANVLANGDYVLALKA